MSSVEVGRGGVMGGIGMGCPDEMGALRMGIFLPLAFMLLLV